MDTYGCQQNEADSERLRGYLARIGFDFSDTPEGADLVLVNTCAIREHAEHRVFGPQVLWRFPELLLRKLTDGERDFETDDVPGAVAAALDISHIHVTSNRSYNNEDALQSAVYLAYIFALNRYTVIKEMTTGKGFADVVFVPFMKGTLAMIVELKRNGSAESALRQIREKQYFDSLSRYEGNLLFVGISYDEKEKTHSCRIERFVKHSL